MKLDELPISQTFVSWANGLDSAGEDSTEARGRLNMLLLFRLYIVMREVIRWAKEMDAIKKYVFYGKGMLPSIGVSQVLGNYSFPVADTFDRAMPRLKTHEMMRVFHGMSGIIDEGGELLTILFNYLFGSENQFDNIDAPLPFDWDNLVEEVGDSLWYHALLAKAKGHLTFDKFMMGNKAKLETRYHGSTWNQEGALNRDTKAEMQALVEKTGSTGEGPIHPAVAEQLDPKTVAFIEQMEGAIEVDGVVGGVLTGKSSEWILAHLSQMITQYAGTESGNIILKSPLFVEVYRRLTLTPATPQNGTNPE